MFMTGIAVIPLYLYLVSLLGGLGMAQLDAEQVLQVLIVAAADDPKSLANAIKRCRRLVVKNSTDNKVS